MVKSKIWHVQRIKLFQGMTAQELKELDRITQMELVKKNETIYIPGDASQHVYLIKSGRVKIARISEKGREVTLAILERGEIFGELAIVDDAPRDTLVQALDDSRICAIQKNLFLSMIRQKPEICIRMARLIGFRMRRIENLVENLVFRDVPSRLAHLLVQLSKDYGKHTPQGMCLEIKLTHQEVANLIGSIRETVSATIGEFKKEGLITYEGRQITLLRPHLLKRRF